VLDRAQDTQPRRHALLKGVKTLTIRYLGEGNEWQTAWPPYGSHGTSEASVDLLPRAVEVVVELDDWGEIRRVFDLPGE
jgi:type II secretion system protein J